MEPAETVQKRLADLETVWADFDKKLYLDKIKIKDWENVDLNISKETLASMDSESIYLLCMDWAKYSLALQKAINIEQGRYNWADSNLNIVLVKRASEFPGFAFEERKMGVLSNDSYAKELSRMKITCKMAVDHYAYITTKIDFITKIAMAIADLKRKNKNDRRDYQTIN